MPPRQRSERPDIVTFDRATFFQEVWDYHIGDCATFLAPYGGGKTHIALEALGYTATPQLPATLLVMKPEDSTIERFIKTHPDYRVVRDWPPAKITLRGKLFGDKPAGYVLWPPETGDPDRDDASHERVFRRCVRMMYSAGRKQKSIIFADETYSLENELDMKRDLRRLWTKGRSVGVGLWAASQRPAYISMWAYQAQHLFIGHDPDLAAQKRYGEIGAGFDPDVIRMLVSQLKRYQFLYINRDERAMCIIDAS